MGCLAGHELPAQQAARADMPHVLGRRQESHHSPERAEDAPLQAAQRLGADPARLQGADQRRHRPECRQPGGLQEAEAPADGHAPADSDPKVHGQASLRDIRGQPDAARIARGCLYAGDRESASHAGGAPTILRERRPCALSGTAVVIGHERHRNAHSRCQRHHWPAYQGCHGEGDTRQVQEQRANDNTDQRRRW